MALKWLHCIKSIWRILCLRYISVLYLPKAFKIHLCCFVLLTKVAKIWAVIQILPTKNQNQLIHWICHAVPVLMKLTEYECNTTYRQELAIATACGRRLRTSSSIKSCGCYIYFLPASTDTVISHYYKGHRWVYNIIWVFPSAFAFLAESEAA